MKRAFNFIFRSALIILFVVASSSYVNMVETKSYSDNINKTVNLSTMALEAQPFQENDIYRAKHTFTGDLTGYVYNCPLCGDFRM